jgi:nitrogen fixation/metabolism regulation signal transduction histidine kinase
MNRNSEDRIATGAKVSKTVRWMVGIGVTILLTIGLGLLVLLTQATSNRALYDRNYERLYMVNTVVAVLLLLGLLWGLTRLIIRVRQGQFGSRLLVKLAAINSAG